MVWVQLPPNLDHEKTPEDQTGHRCPKEEGLNPSLPTRYKKINFPSVIVQQLTLAIRVGK